MRKIIEKIFNFKTFHRFFWSYKFRRGKAQKEN